MDSKDIMLDRFKGVFTNIHTKERKKILKVEVVKAAKGGFVIEFEDNERWSIDDFCKCWTGVFDSI